MFIPLIAASVGSPTSLSNLDDPFSTLLLLGSLVYVMTYAVYRFYKFETTSNYKPNVCLELMMLCLLPITVFC